MVKTDFIETDEKSLEYSSLPNEPQVSGEVKSLYTLKNTLSDQGQYILCKWAFDIDSVCAGDGLVKPLEKKYIHAISVVGSCRGTQLVRLVYQWST